MQIAQRTCLITMLIVFFMSGASLLYGEKEDKLLQRWEQVQSEDFLKHLCRTGSCSLDEYLQFCQTLSKGGIEAEICVMEYQKERDAEKKVYYYLISWEEIRKQLLENGAYYFEEGNVLKVSVMQKSRTKSRQQTHFGMIDGGK